MATPFETKLTQSAEAERLANRLRGDLEVLHGAPLRLMELLEALRKEVLQTEIGGQGRLTAAALQQEIDTVRNRTLQRIDALEAECEEARQRIEAALDEAERGQDGDVQAAVLRELREQRTWTRIKALLDSADDGALFMRLRDIIQRAAQDGDDITLAALAAEVPAYLELRRQASYAPEVLASITRARLPHLAPAARKAIAVRQELNEGWPRLAASFEMARTEATGRGGRVAALPGWRGVETVTA